MRAALYSRVSTDDQSTRAQAEELRQYAKRRGWTVVLELEETMSGAKNNRPKRAEILRAAQQRKIDVAIVTRLDRWGRSAGDVINTIDHLHAVGVTFVSINDAIDFTTPMGEALLGIMAVFAQLERKLIGARVKAGIEHARANGALLGPPRTARCHSREVIELARQGLSKREIARRVKISRASVIRILRGAEDGRTTRPAPDCEA
jgi:DNA invertase Pin-like site-specific DNA recombinase